jgi:opacity protein-like surface antigen
MPRKHLFAAAILLVLTAAVAYAAQVDTVRFSVSMHDAFLKMNGSPVHRFTATPDATTAESNLTASGGTAVAYTLFGGERICLQAITTDAYVQVIAAASMTAAGALGFTIKAGDPLLSNCLTLLPGELSVSILCTASGPCLVKGFELR